MKGEDAIHCAIIQWLGIVLPKSALYWHTPNGGKRSAREAAKFKRMGVLPGIPDIFILFDSRLISLEVKDKGKYQTPVQIYMEDELNKQGVCYYIVRSIDDAKEALILEGII